MRRMKFGLESIELSPRRETDDPLSVERSLPDVDYIEKGTSRLAREWARLEKERRMGMR